MLSPLRFRAREPGRPSHAKLRSPISSSGSMRRTRGLGGWAHHVTERRRLRGTGYGNAPPTCWAPRTPVGDLCAMTRQNV